MDYADEENILTNNNQFYCSGRKMRSNKRYDYIVDICHLVLNSRHILGIRFAKEQGSMFASETVIELIQDPVLNQGVDVSTIIMSKESI
jgi:hypothetical protein